MNVTKLLEIIGSVKSKTRMIIGFSLLLTLFIIALVGSIFNSHNLSKSMNDLYDYPFAFNTAILKVNTEIYKMQFLLGQSTDAYDEVRAKHKQVVKQKDSLIVENLEIAKKAHLGPQHDIDTIITTYTNWKPTRDSIFELADANNIFDAQDLVANSSYERIQMLDTLLANLNSNAEKNAYSFVTKANTQAATFNFVILAVAFVSIALCIAIGSLLSLSILSPIKSALTVANNMKTGNLSHRINTTLKDEFGELATALDATCHDLGTMIKDISDETQVLSDSSYSVMSLTKSMKSSAEQSSKKTNAATDRINGVKNNAQIAAESIKETAEKTESIATATTEMSNTISEIARNSDEAKGMSNCAVKLSSDISEYMKQLQNSSKDIGNITETINDISEQTSLLALNATIEAARAGEAGKGFAVVANEIKALSRQTADATNNIHQQIETTQSVTTKTVKDIENIIKVIKDVNEIINIIASTSEQQSETTNDIAKNISYANQSVSSAYKNFTENSNLIEGIANDISDINNSTNTVLANSSSVNDSAQSVQAIAIRLKTAMERFKV